MDKKLPICIVLVMLMSCFSCKQPQQPTEDADMDTQWVDSSQHLYQYGICIDSLDVKEYLMKNGDNPASIFSGLGFTALKADIRTGFRSVNFMSSIRRNCEPACIITHFPR